MMSLNMRCENCGKEETVYGEVGERWVCICGKRNELKAPVKHDSGKLRYDLIPPELIKALAAIYTWGVTTKEQHPNGPGYAENSWKEVEEKRYLAAEYRHKMDDMFGVDIYDKESGYLHVAHEFWNVGAKLYNRLKDNALRG